jgi:hypothetical protein
MRNGVYMDDYEQYNDQLQTEQRLETISEKLEAGDTLTIEEIDLWRWACGLPIRKRPNVFDQIFQDWATIWRKAGGI